MVQCSNSLVNNGFPGEEIKHTQTPPHELDGADGIFEENATLRSSFFSFIFFFFYTRPWKYFIIKYLSVSFVFLLQ